jgi:hypothetical protein
MEDFERRNPVAQIRRQAVRFSWHNAAAEYIDVYREVL